MNDIFNIINGDISGILYAEDFDDDFEALQENSMEPDDSQIVLEPLESYFTQSDIDRAVAQARDETRKLVTEELAETRESQKLAALGQIAAGITECSVMAREAAEKFSNEMGKIILDSVVAVFPELGKKFGHREVSSIISIIGNGLNAGNDGIILINPQTADLLLSDPHVTERIRLSGFSVECRDDLLAGDIKISWGNGFLERDVNQIVRNLIADISQSFEALSVRDE